MVDSTTTEARDIRRVGVVGCGLMGSGIADVCAKAGLRVRVAEVTEQAAKAGRERLLGSLERAARRGKLSEADRDAALERLSFGHDLAELADSDLVIEAVAENERMKTEVFATLDKVVDRRDAILATNTSSIPVTRLGMATTRPGQVIGIHFFNPVPVLRLVEIVPSLRTDSTVVERAELFATTVLKKQVVKARDRAGFIVNALLIPYLLSAIRMVESSLATAEDIDNGMVLGCAHPMGPLRLADLIGLDTTLAIAESLYAEFREPQYAAPALLSRMVDAGLLGKKSGHGFYDYSE